MKAPTAVAIYARISRDVEGTGAGVARQVQDCHKLAESLGWAVAGEYVDNDLSGYSGKHRPEYERMLTDLADGYLDGVLVYHVDRLTRRPIELEQFLNVVDRAKVKHVRFVTGDTDISTGDGLLMARLLAAVAANESASKSRRVARKHEQSAAEGKPHRGSTRPFGYESDHTTIRADEAQVYRELVARYLAGESMRSMAIWLNEQQVPTVRGASWLTTTLRGMLENPRYAGLRARRGEVVATGQWEPIITEVEHRRVLAKMTERKASGRRDPQRYLLRGMLRCGKCAKTLYSSARRDSRRYVCKSGPDHGGCGRLTVVADPLERFLADAVLYRLDTDELADVLRGRGNTDERTDTLRTNLAAVEQRRMDLSDAYAAGHLDMQEWLRAKAPLQAQAENLERQLARLNNTTALAGLVGNGAALGRSWGSLNLSRQNAIVAAVIDHAVIGPGSPGVQVLDPSRVSVVWRH
jgi:site-specific DNA recombinase